MPQDSTFLRLNRDAVDAIASLFGAAPVLEPYTPDGEPVYRLTLTGRADGIEVLLWPSLARVDVSSTGTHGWVLKDVGEIDVIEGVEVIFRPAAGRGFLFVAVNGFVNMVMG
ncbi:MAG TPA: hypothetical protein VFY10_15940 [Dehalococcoidia bacterium]|nr:hypothetical protein [Dehalococcoidia bacterium]